MFSKGELRLLVNFDLFFKSILVERLLRVQDSYDFHGFFVCDFKDKGASSVPVFHCDTFSLRYRVNTERAQIFLSIDLAQADAQELRLQRVAPGEA